MVTDALTLPREARAQVTETLPEVIVRAPPAPVGRGSSSCRLPARSAPPRRASRPLARLGPRCLHTRPLTSVPASTRAPTSRVPGCRDHAGDRPRLRPRQGTGDGADAPCRGLLARLFAKRDSNAGAAHPGRLHERRPGQRVHLGFALSRLRRLAAAGHPARARGLHERHPRQRGFRRHRQLGPHPDHRHRPRRRLDQQSGLRPQRARRRDQASR